MPTTTVGLTDALKGLIGESFTAFSNANAHIGVGGGAGATTAFAAGQTDLQGASKTRKAMDATYPQRSGLVLTFKATFAAADANYTWDEWGIFNASAAADMFSRKVENHGTKVNTDTWVFTVTHTSSLA